MANEPRNTRSLAERIGRRQKLAKRIRMVFLGGGIIFAIVTFGSALFWPPINDVTTGKTPQYSELDPQIYDLPRREVYQHVLETLQAGEKFEITKEIPDRYRIKATCKSILFTDDMTIWLKTHGPRKTIVYVRSKSRFGKGDFGANARHIRRFFKALDQQIGSS